MHNVTLIKGDGIGPSIMDEAVKVIDASGVKIHWEEVYAGMAAFEKFGTPLPDETMASFDKTRLAFKGPLTTVVGTGFRSINVALRQKYELYANVRPAKSWAGIKTRYEDVDIVIVRENTEGLYAGLEHYLTPKKDIAESLAVVTRSASQRIIDYAFKYAQDNNRKKVTVCHKANILKYTQGLFLDVARETAARYPDIQFDEKIIDAACMHMVMNPQQFDVVVWLFSIRSISEQDNVALSDGGVFDLVPCGLQSIINIDATTTTIHTSDGFDERVAIFLH